MFQKVVTCRALVLFLWQPECYYHTLPFIMKGLQWLVCEAGGERGRQKAAFFSPTWLWNKSQTKTLQCSVVRESLLTFTGYEFVCVIFCCVIMTGWEREKHLQYRNLNMSHVIRDQVIFIGQYFFYYNCPVSLHFDVTKLLYQKCVNGSCIN